mmetsp:Transcript_10866/g.23019  ORF Transcript_10866/g.23019 Transcript_10866/m.23019 type:complete len:249 (+) Transcript_10866:1050-1796(+)
MSFSRSLTRKTSSEMFSAVAAGGDEDLDAFFAGGLIGMKSISPKASSVPLQGFPPQNPSSTGCAWEGLKGLPRQTSTLGLSSSSFSKAEAPMEYSDVDGRWLPWFFSRFLPVLRRIPGWEWRPRPSDRGCCRGPWSTLTRGAALPTDSAPHSVASHFSRFPHSIGLESWGAKWYGFGTGTPPSTSSSSSSSVIMVVSCGNWDPSPATERRVSHSSLQKHPIRIVSIVRDSTTMIDCVIAIHRNPDTPE